MTIAGHECREITHAVSGRASMRGRHCATGRAAHLSSKGNIWRHESDGEWKLIFDRGCPVCDCAPKKE